MYFLCAGLHGAVGRRKDYHSVVAGSSSGLTGDHLSGNWWLDLGLDSILVIFIGLGV